MLASTENPLSTPFFLAAGNLTVAGVSSWPELSGELLLLLSVALALPYSRDAL